MVSIWNKKKQNGTLGSQLDDLDQDPLFGDAVNSGQ